jgi:hypothetical protein
MKGVTVPCALMCWGASRSRGQPLFRQHLEVIVPATWRLGFAFEVGQCLHPALPARLGELEADHSDCNIL